MGTPIKALVVDDEPLARSDLRAILKQFTQIEIIGEADSIKSAKDIIDKEVVDVVFLDIQLPGETGFDLLPYIGFDIEVIFVTAFDEYAIQAFEANTLDYLLKPVSEDRLAKSIQRLSNKKESQSESQAALLKDDSIFVKLANSYHFIRINTIIKIEAADDYSEVYLTSGESFIVLKSMKIWEQRLPSNTFTRVHRSTIVNLDQVERVEPWFNNRHKVYLKMLSEPVIMSRRFFTDIRKRLG